MSEAQIQVWYRDATCREFSEYAREKVATALMHTALPVLKAMVALDRSKDPAVARPAMASVEVDLNGSVVRAHAEATSHAEAIDLMQDRLRGRMARLSHR